MKIVEINEIKDIDILLSIMMTYQKSEKQLQVSKKQLTIELSEAGDNRLIYIGYLDGKAVAMIQLILNNADNNPEYANGRDICHVHNLQVRSDHQKQGIGWKMMDFIEDQAKKLGKSIITLGVDGDNERAIKMYKNREYQIFKKGEGRTPDEFCYDMSKKIV